MTESVFETVEKSCQILKLDFSSAELAILAQEQKLTPVQLQAIGMVMDHLRQKKVDTTIKGEGCRGKRLETLTLQTSRVKAPDPEQTNMT